MERKEKKRKWRRAVEERIKRVRGRKQAIMGKGRKEGFG